MATIMYEGTPLRPDAGIWWKICRAVQGHRDVLRPTAIRVLKKQDPAFLKKYDLSSLQAPVPAPASRSTRPPTSG